MRHTRQRPPRHVLVLPGHALAPRRPACLTHLRLVMLLAVVHVAQGLEWVARNLRYPAIVHMSLEGYYSTAINAAVDELVNT